ncbi:MAG TPA: flagellar basal-body rod protein FlgF [Bryobacteraceae bacterium]|nr:flagellar basal-body rod protein FlgF [Bryobacteraceae bacterium]
MDPLTISAASGLRSRMESLDLLANNIANTETSGYKTDREFYNLYISADAMVADAADPATLPVIERNYTDFSQGTLRPTSNTLDFALQGQGFFTVNAPGGVAYSRNGAFKVTSAGNLATADGFNVLNKTGQPIAIDPALPVTVSADGIISQSGQNVGQLAVVDFANGDLVKQGSTLFRPSNPNVRPRASSAEVLQGKLEGSNVGSAESTVRLVNVMRQFEMLQKAVNIAGEMDRKSISEVAKV